MVASFVQNMSPISAPAPRSHNIFPRIGSHSTKMGLSDANADVPPYCVDQLRLARTNLKENAKKGGAHTFDPRVETLSSLAHCEIERAERDPCGTAYKPFQLRSRTARSAA